MAIPALPPAPALSPAEAAQIPSVSLPVGSQISHLVAEFTQLSVQLFAILAAPPSSSAGSAPTAPIYEALARVDDKLARLLAMYDTHQAQQARIDALIASLGSLDKAWHASASTLHACARDLAPIVESGALDRESITAAREAGAALAPQSLLAYGRLLAPFTSAPPSSLFRPEVKLRGVGATDPTGRTLPPGAIPPFPTETVMRRGRLQFGREGLLQGLGKTNEVGGHRGGPDVGHREQPTRPDAAAQLEQEARTHDMGGAGAHLDGMHGLEEEDFDFDLDLNPDL